MYARIRFAFQLAIKSKAVLAALVTGSELQKPEDTQKKIRLRTLRDFDAHLRSRRDQQFTQNFFSRLGTNYAVLFCRS